MTARHKLGALIGAALLTFAATATAFAAAPVYSIDVTKTANPPVVPVAGWTVTFTVWVENDGTGPLNAVNVTDDMVGCTLAGPFGDQASGTGSGQLEVGETWSYTCTVTGVVPDTTNTAHVAACHNGADCANPENQAASGEASVTVVEGVPPTAPPTAVPPTAGPSVPAPPPTDTVPAGGAAGMGDITWFLVVAVGLLLGSMVVMSPARIKNKR